MPDVLTFDCYGTLIDWEAGILAGLRAACPEAMDVADRDLLSAFHREQNALKTSEYRPYRTLLTEVTLALAAARGWPAGRREAARVPDGVPSWIPFPDTNPALERLVNAGYRLWILSNIDDDMLAGTLRHFTAPFERTITAQQLRSYKPAPAHFLAAREQVGGDDARMVHLAQSLFHDIRPAGSLGLRVVWVNRTGEARPADVEPLHESRDLAGAVDWLLTRFGPAGRSGSPSSDSGS